MGRKILAITYHFPPSAASGTHRLLGLSQFLPQFGWQVAVIAPRTLPWEPVDEQLLKRVPPSTRIYDAAYPTSWLTKPIRKFFRYGAWLPRALNAFRKAHADYQPDIIFTSGPPHCVHLAGLAIKSLYGIPWVADFRDPWMAGQFDRISSFDKRFGSTLERRVFDNADAIVVNAPNAKLAIDKCYPAHSKKSFSVTNGFDPAQFEGITRRCSSPKFVISHVGELYAGRDPRPLLDAVQILINALPALRERLVVEFVGVNRDHRNELVEEAKRRMLADVVRTVEQVPYRESLEHMVNADVLLLLDTPGRQLGVPAKLYEYLGANRPIIALADEGSDVQWVLRESGTRFELARMCDSTQIAKSLRFLLSERDGAQVRTNVSAFTRQAIAEQMSDILYGIVRARAVRVAQTVVSK